MPQQFVRPVFESTSPQCHRRLLALADSLLGEGAQPLLAGRASRGATFADGTDPFEAATFEEFKNLSEALFFRRKLDGNNGNVKRTAEQLGMQRSHLYKKLDRYELRS